MKSFTFNKVYIIRSLDPNPIHRILWIPGDVLYNDLRSVGVPCELHDVQNGLVEFHQVMIKIAEDCKTQDVKPIIHFICHGAKPSKEYPTGAMALWEINQFSIFPWQSILPYLEYINMNCQVNLFVSMCVCHGFFSLLHLLDENHRIPFCGLLSSPDPVDSRIATISFSNFYLSLLRNKDVNKAIEELATSLQPFKSWYKSMGLSIEEYLVLFSDDLFTKAAKDDFKKHRSTIFKLWQLGARIFGRITNRNIRNSRIIAFIRVNFGKYPAIFKQVRDYKFMLDLYPQQRKRFDLPHSIKDLQN